MTIFITRKNNNIIWIHFVFWTRQKQLLMYIILWNKTCDVDELQHLNLENFQAKTWKVIVFGSVYDKNFNECHTYEVQHISLVDKIFFVISQTAIVPWCWTMLFKYWCVITKLYRTWHQTIAFTAPTKAGIDHRAALRVSNCFGHVFEWSKVNLWR